MSMTEMYGAVRSLEAIENYAKAKIPSTIDYQAADSCLIEHIKRGEKQFWKKIFAGEITWNNTVILEDLALSQWVGRVPGLFWTPNARKIRKLASQAGEYESKKWKALSPLGKSRKVMGGVGTLKFPPDLQGYHLCSLTAGLNASAGIPILISPEIWDHHKLTEGSVIQYVKTKWKSMSGTTWSERFPLTQRIPKGFLVLDNPNDLKKDCWNKVAATRFHPFTVMEYSKKTATLYDFVYATADTGENYRTYIKKFFENYKNAEGRYGRYLLAAEIDNQSDPFWHSEFESPEALRRAEPNAKSQLELLQERIQEKIFDGKNLDDIIQILTKRYQNDDLILLSSDIGIPDSAWYGGRSVAKSAVDFLAECIRRGKVPMLIEILHLVYPQRIPLRNILANLYPTIEDSRLLVKDAGIPSEQIAFNTKAILNWHAILREAELRNKIFEIVRIAYINTGNIKLRQIIEGKV